MIPPPYTPGTTTSSSAPYTVSILNTDATGYTVNASSTDGAAGPPSATLTPELHLVSSPAGSTLKPFGGTISVPSSFATPAAAPGVSAVGGRTAGSAPVAADLWTFEGRIAIDPLFAGPYERGDEHHRARLLTDSWLYPRDRCPRVHATRHGREPVRWLNIATAAVLAAVAVAVAPSRGSAISVSPSQTRIGPGEGQSFLVGSDLSERAEVSARLADFVPSATGSVRIDPRRRPARSATPWLSLSASRLVIDGGSSGTVGVQARNPGIVAPGDYYSLLLSMRAPSRGPVPITLTVGAPIIVRVPGELRRSARVGGCGSSGRGRGVSSGFRSATAATSTRSCARLRPHRSPSWPQGRRAAGGEPAQHPPRRDRGDRHPLPRRVARTRRGDRDGALRRAGARRAGNGATPRTAVRRATVRVTLVTTAETPRS